METSCPTRYRVHKRRHGRIHRRKRRFLCGGDDANRDANNDANPNDKDETIVAIVLDRITKDPYITQAKLSELTGVSRRTIQRITKALSGQGKLERIGGTRGYWEVKTINNSQ